MAVLPLLRVVPVTTLQITTENEVAYVEDVVPSAFATKNGTTPAKLPNNFPLVTIIADITQVNGESVSGLFVGRTAAIRATPPLPPPKSSVPPGWAVADFARTALREAIFEIRQVGRRSIPGQPIGTIMALGFAGGDPPPGIPSATTGLLSQQGANLAIVGGTGAFLGARGQAAGTMNLGRQASMQESPTYRRGNIGKDANGNIINEENTYFLHIIPMVIPEVVAFNGKQNNVKLARGETVVMLASGIGPTNSVVQPTQPWQGNLPVNSPVTVTLNGQNIVPKSAVSAEGFLGYYFVTFTVPQNAALGKATLVLTVAWITSPPFQGTAKVTT